MAGVFFSVVVSLAFIKNYSAGRTRIFKIETTLFVTSERTLNECFTVGIGLWKRGIKIYTITWGGLGERDEKLDAYFSAREKATSNLISHLAAEGKRGEDLIYYAPLPVVFCCLKNYGKIGTNLNFFRRRYLGNENNYDKSGSRLWFSVVYRRIVEPWMLVSYSF